MLIAGGDERAVGGLGSSFEVGETDAKLISVVLEILQLLTAVVKLLGLVVVGGGVSLAVKVQLLEAGVHIGSQGVDGVSGFH